MASKRRSNVSQSSESTQARPSTTGRIILPGVDVVREGRAEPFLEISPTLSSATVQWFRFQLSPAGKINRLDIGQAP